MIINKNMRKFLLSIATLTLFAASNVFATQVEVTMNAKSKLIKSLVNITTSESVNVGNPTRNKIASPSTACNSGLNSAKS